MISWVFFDLGGTLLDESAYHDAIVRAYVDLMNEHGVHVTLDEFLAVRDLLIARLTSPLFVTTCTEFTKDPQVTETIRRDAWARVAGAEVTMQHAFPEAREVLEVVGRHASLGIIANQHPNVRDVLRRDGLESFFRVVVISEERGVAKPDRTLFSLALREAGCKPREAVMVGDRIDNDVEPARALDLRTVLVRNGVFRHQLGERAGQRPDVEVPSLRDVPHAIDRLARET